MAAKNGNDFPIDFYSWGKHTDSKLITKDKQISEDLQETFDSIEIKPDDTTPEIDYTLSVKGKEQSRIVIPTDFVNKDLSNIKDEISSLKKDVENIIERIGQINGQLEKLDEKYVNLNDSITIEQINMLFSKINNSEEETVVENKTMISNENEIELYSEEADDEDYSKETTFFNRIKNIFN